MWAPQWHSSFNLSILSAIGNVYALFQIQYSRTMQVTIPEFHSLGIYFLPISIFVPSQPEQTAHGQGCAQDLQAYDSSQSCDCLVNHLRFCHRLRLITPASPSKNLTRHSSFNYRDHVEPFLLQQMNRQLTCHPRCNRTWCIHWIHWNITNPPITPPTFHRHFLNSTDSAFRTNFH